MAKRECRVKHLKIPKRPTSLAAKTSYAVSPQFLSSYTRNLADGDGIRIYRAVTKKYALMARPTPITIARTFWGSAFCA
jgi:hypothetical protein